MDKLKWLFGMRYELSADGAGLLKYLSPTNFYHIHSDEMILSERFRHRALTSNKGKVRFSL